MSFPHLSLPLPVLQNRFHWGLSDTRQVVFGAERQRTRRTVPPPGLLAVEQGLHRFRSVQCRAVQTEDACPSTGREAPQSAALADPVADVACRNGFASPESLHELARINHRLRKFRVWAHRARRDPSGWRAWLRPGKSPLRVLSLDAQYGQLSAAPADGCLAASLGQVIERLASSCKLRLADGFRWGVNTGGVTVLLGQLLSGWLIRLRLSVKWHRQREAFVEFSQTSHFFEIQIGVLTQRHLSLGGLVGVGPHLGPFNVGVQAFVEPWVRERSWQQGVCIRIPTLHGEAAAKQTAAGVLGVLLAPASADSDICRQVWRQYPEVSIGPIGRSVQDLRRAQAGLEVSASVGVSLARVQMQAGLHVQRTHTNRDSARQDFGRIRVLRGKQGHARALWAVAGARVGASLRLDPQWQGAAGPGELALVQTRLGGADAHVRQELGEQDGRILERSYFELEHSHPEDALSALQALREQTEDDTGETTVSGRWSFEPPPGTRLGYAQRYELRPDIRARMDAFPAQRDALLRRPEHYRLASLRTYARSARLQRVGVSLGLLVQRLRSAQSVSCIS